MNWRHRGRLAGLAIMTVGFVSANAGHSIGPAAAGTGDPIVSYEAHDRLMNSAAAEARDHLDQFLSLVLEEDGMATPDAGVKVAIPLAEGGHEIIWISPFGIDGDQFVGLLANEPSQIENFAAGDLITFDKDQVRDWFFYGPDGKMYGSFTTRVMLADMSTNSAARIRDMLSEAPLPANW